MLANQLLEAWARRSSFAWRYASWEAHMWPHIVYGDSFGTTEEDQKELRNRFWAILSGEIDYLA